MRLFLHKLMHWEYWPSVILYIPVYFYWGWLSIRARTPFFFNAANPGITHGGFMAESKMEIHKILPPYFSPATILVEHGSDIKSAIQHLSKSGIEFPLIAKPDIGLRGQAVKILASARELEKYHEKAQFDFLLQQLIPYKNEVGIFYVRYPREASGKITGIVGKEFLKVTGDGTSTIAQLLQRNPRHAIQLKVLRREYGDGLDQIPAFNQVMNLVPFGNHARGAKFIDLSHLISPKLTAAVDAICNQIPGFFFGRLDIMYQDWNGLETGRDFMIVELNGTSSEPTHIYDPAHSVFFAWRELIRHVRMMYQVGLENRRTGIRYLSLQEGIRAYRIHRAQSRKIAAF